MMETMNRETADGQLEKSRQITDIKETNMFDTIPGRFSVIPVKGKIPLVKWQEFTERRPSDDERQNWAAQFPGCDYGIVTGKVSGIFCLDIDGDAGQQSIKDLHIPRTPSVKTPHGTHYYFRWINDLDGRTTTKAGVLPNVDVRGQNGFVRFYSWLVSPMVAPLAAPPQWLIDLLPKKDGREVGAGFKATLDAVRPGNRNQTFASLAGSLRARGYGFDEIYGLLEPKAREVDFPLTELRMVCQSMMRYTPSTTVHNEMQGESVETFLEDQEPVKWICKPFIAEQSIGIIGGLPESRKSWIMVDLAVECARGGGLWLNKFPVAGAKVLLIDQERSKSEVQRRLKAILAGKGLSAADIRSQLFVRSGTSSRIDLQPSFDALRKEISDLRPTLILVDSLATFHTLNESSRGEIQRVMERIKELRNEFKCSVLLIHHETKNSYQNKKDGAEPSYLDLAGNVAIPAAAEVVINVVKHDPESSFVHHTKSTQGSKAPPFLVRVRDGKPDGSEIVVEAF